MSGKEKFAKVAFKSNKTGATIQGEFVVGSSNAYQVAVDGKVRVLDNQEWIPTALPSSQGSPFDNLFGGMR